MKKLLYSLMILILLTGCAELQFAKSAIRHGGAQLADDSLNITLWKLCNATTYGAIKRKFGDSNDKAEALHTLCGGAREVDLVTSDYDN